MKGKAFVEAEEECFLERASVPFGGLTGGGPNPPLCVLDARGIAPNAATEDLELVLHVREIEDLPVATGLGPPDRRLGDTPGATPIDSLRDQLLDELGSGRFRSRQLIQIRLRS